MTPANISRLTLVDFLSRMVLRMVAQMIIYATLRPTADARPVQSGECHDRITNWECPAIQLLGI